MATSLKDVGKSTPVVEVIRRVLEGKTKPVTVEELTVHVMDSWNRDFPGTPYEDVALVYKLATRLLGCQVFFDEVDDEVPVVEGLEERDEPIPLHPRMSFEELNRIADLIRHVKLLLPPSSTVSVQVEDKAPAGGRRKKS